MIVPVILQRIGSGMRGDRWRVTHAGIVIVETSRDPEHDACRVLLTLGITGTLETRHAGSAIVSMRLDIERGARRTVIENRQCGPKFGQWQPYNRAPRLAPAVAQSASEQGVASRVIELAT